MPSKYILTPYFLDEPLAGLAELERPGWALNTPALSGATQMERLGVIHGELAGHVEEVIRQGSRPVSIAGDCCAALGVYAGLHRSGIDPQLIWFDAHGDFNTWETSPSGFLGGMPLAMLAGLGEQTILEVLEIDPLPQEQIILTDARDLDPGERELVESSLLTHLQDPRALLSQTLPDRPLWVHFDTDVVDPAYVPAQNYTAPGGLSPDELGRVFQHLADTGRITAVSLSSWAPDLPGAEVSRDASLALLEILSG
ncbi:MAG: arginase family protein [Anaerolineales bacterium]